MADKMLMGGRRNRQKWVLGRDAQSILGLGYWGVFGRLGLGIGV
jgi:hypothetical protein